MLAKSSKGFNLFTALVSFLLIALSVLLINGMIQTERSASTRIGQEQSMAELQAVADMARADAMQVFNYGMRKAIEDWMTDPSTGGVTLDLSEKSWEDIKRAFAEEKFGGERGGREFAGFVTNTLIAIFYSEAHFGNYVISLEGNLEELRTAMVNLTIQSVAEEDFFQVIECETGDPRQCPKGTFYVNFKVLKLSQEDYEKLPRIRVVNVATRDEIKEVILPRANFKIYVPLRIFKAIAEARALAHFPLENGEINRSSDKGLFSARVHNTIEEMGIGMCDKDICNPRGTPFAPPASNSIGGICPGNDVFPGEVNVNLTNPWTGQATSYNANDPEDMKKVLEGIAKSKVCKVVEDAKAAQWIDYDPPAGDDKFKLVAGAYCGYLQELDVSADAMISKNIVQGGGEASGNPGGGASYNPDPCPPNPVRKIGLYIEGGEMKMPEMSYEKLACAESSSVGYPAGKSHCVEIKKISVKLWFREYDTTYMVDKTKAEKCETNPNNCPIYSIKLLDNRYVPFTANWEQGSLTNDCFYTSQPMEQNCNFSQGWTCIMHVKEAEPAGCSPA